MVILIASVSTVALLVVLTSYYYQHQYRSGVIGNNHLVRFNVTNDRKKNQGFLKFILPPKMGKHGFLILPIQMMANSIRTVQKYQEIQMEVGM